MDKHPSTDPLQWMIDFLLELDQWQDRIVLKRYDHLRMAGDCDTNIYYIKSGCLRAYLCLETGKDQNIRFGCSGEAVISMPDFITQQPSDLFLQAIRETELLSISRKRYRHLIQSDPDASTARDAIRDLMTLQHIEREKDLLTDAAQDRFQRVLARSPRLFQEVPAKYIANYLRMSPETLSRLLKS